jgi:glucuronate isomerase
LYHDVAVPLRKEVGIIDTITHHNLRQIVENKPFLNIWKAEVLETREEYKNCDHYIIQLAAKIPGFSQKFARDSRISDYDKWVILCKVFPNLEGNHVHQWMHLDLGRMFDIKELLSAETADKVWEVTNKHLQRKEMLPQSILKKIEAKIIFTTDGPADDLLYHKMTNSIEGV